LWLGAGWGGGGKGKKKKKKKTPPPPAIFNFYPNFAGIIEESFWCALFLEPFAN
jgi:hypothetical protein